LRNLEQISYRAASCTAVATVYSDITVVYICTVKIIILPTPRNQKKSRINMSKSQNL